MAHIMTDSGDVVTWFGSGSYPAALTAGTTIPVVDPPQPIYGYSADAITNPLTLWKTQPSLRKVVEFAARQIAQIPLHVYRRTDTDSRERVRTGNLVRTLSRPDFQVTQYQLIESLITDKMVFDMCCAVLVGDNLVRIPPGLLRITSDILGRVTKIEVSKGPADDPIDITGAPKVMTWGWHPTKAGGVSPMHTLAEILRENARAITWRNRQWDLSPKAPVLLRRPVAAPKWSDERRARFENTWNQWLDNPTRGTPILDDGMEVEKMPTLTPKDALDIEGRKLSDAEVASAYHIPPELVGARESNFASIGAFKEMLFGPTLGPAIVELEQAFNTGGLIDALDVTDGLYIEMNREAVLAGSFFEKAKIMQTSTGGAVMTRAEGRARLNLPHIPGTDDLITPLNVTVGGQASPTDSGSQNWGEQNASTENRND